MKNAVIVVGSHHVGKSDTIRNHFKKLLKRPDGGKMTPAGHVFQLNGKLGFVLSQSLEEGKRDVNATVKKLSRYEYLVFAGRPETEAVSEVRALQLALRSASFAVSLIVIMDRDDDRAKKAQQIYNRLCSR